MSRYLLPLLCCGSLFAADQAKAKKAQADLVHVAEVAPKSLVLRLGDRDIGIVHTKVRYDTWIILPPDEAITGAGSGGQRELASKSRPMTSGPPICSTFSPPRKTRAPI